MNEPDPLELASHWIALALGDLAGAEALLRDGGPPVREAAGFAQQAAEKAMKSAIIAGGETPPRTHDLEALARRIPAGWRFHALPARLSRLSEAHVEARYPGYFTPALDRDAAVRLVADARAITNAILDDLSDRGVDRPAPR